MSPDISLRHGTIYREATHARNVWLLGTRRRPTTTRKMALGRLWRLGWPARRARTMARTCRAAVRTGRPEVRDPAAARGEAETRLRDNQRAREPLWRFVRPEPRDGVPDADHARGSR